MVLEISGTISQFSLTTVKRPSSCKQFHRGRFYGPPKIPRTTLHVVFDVHKVWAVCRGQLPMNFNLVESL